MRMDVKPVTKMSVVYPNEIGYAAILLKAHVYPWQSLLQNNAVYPEE